MSNEPKRRILVRANPGNMWATMQVWFRGEWVDQRPYPVVEGPDGTFSVFWVDGGANPIEVVSTADADWQIPPLRPDDKVGNAMKEIVEKAWGKNWEDEANEQRP